MKNVLWLMAVMIIAGCANLGSMLSSSGSSSAADSSVRGKMQACMLTEAQSRFQAGTLFNDTIYNNILIGNKNATREQVLKAAEMAECMPFIEKLPEGIKGLAEKVEAMGLKFGFWIEPEMVNPDSDLYRTHPDWAFSIPGRNRTLSRHQMVLDYSREEVVNYIHDMLYRILKDSKVSYIKWDMNRSITECFSRELSGREQGMVYHKYILGVYSLYERLMSEFPDILFESCASGGGRFDAGMLYYAPQAWCSDNTDGEDRIFIQYGTSYGYPISSMGAHVSAVPNQQTGRTVPITMRGDVAMFGAFGYELDLNHISEEEFKIVQSQIRFVKEHRKLLQYGTLYRLRSPFEADQAAWMVVSQDKKEAILAVYTMRAVINKLPGYLKLQGLDPDAEYNCNGKKYYGDELMQMGIPMNQECISGYCINNDGSSAAIVFKAE